MEFQALIINPEDEQRNLLRTYLSLTPKIAVQDFATDTDAMEWLNQCEKKVEFVFLCWDMKSRHQNSINVLRQHEATKDALIFVITSQGDYGWIKSVFSLNELIDNILVKPFVATEFRKRITNLLSRGIGPSSTALVVDDDDEARNILQQYLQACGFGTVLQATDGSEALHFLMERSSEISIVVSDWEMPQVNGVQLLQAMRLNPKYSSIPFVMVTAQTSIDQIALIQMAEMGVSDYLMKPFNMKSFKEKIERALQHLKSQEEAKSSRISAEALKAQGEHEKCIQLLEESLLRDPKNAELLEALGDASCELETHGPDKAHQYYTKALEVCPHKSSLVMKAFHLCVSLEKIPEAIRLLKRYLSHVAFDEHARVQLGRLYLQNGDYGAACVEFRRALTINPSSEEAQSLYEVATSLKKVA